MTNREKGEVELKAGDQTYTLAFGWNEIAEVETLLDVSFFEGIAPKFQNPPSIRGGEWRALLWAALRKHHKGIDVLAAGEIMNQIGIEKLGIAIGKLIEVAFPSADEAEVAENPQQASPSAGKTL